MRTGVGSSDVDLVAIALASAAQRQQPADSSSSSSWPDHCRALRLLFTALSLLGRASEGEAAVVARITRPLLGALLSPLAVDDGARGSFRGLPRACDALVTLLLVSGGGGGGAAARGVPSASAAVSLPGQAASAASAASPAALGAVLAACLAASGGLPGFDPLVALVWAPFVSTLSSSLPAWATPTALAAFATSYGAVSGLFQRLLSTAATLPHVLRQQPGGEETDGGVPATEALLRCAASAELRQSLSPKLEVFQALRTADLTSRLDRACASSRPSVGSIVATLDAGVAAGAAAEGSAGGSAGVTCLWSRELLRDVPDVPGAAGHGNGGRDRRFLLVLPATAAAWACLAGVWSPGAFIPSLHKQCLSLTLVLAMRYGTWSAAGAAQGAVACDAPAVLAALQGQEQLPRHTDADDEPQLPPCSVSAWADAARKAPSHPRAAAAASGSSGSSGGGLQADLSSWADGAGSAAVHLAAAHDAASLALLLRCVLAPRVLAALGLPQPSSGTAPGTAGGASAAVCAAIYAVATHLEALIPLHYAVARAATSAACIAGVAVSPGGDSQMPICTRFMCAPSGDAGHASCPCDL